MRGGVSLDLVSAVIVLSLPRWFFKSILEGWNVYQRRFRSVKFFKSLNGCAGEGGASAISMVLYLQGGGVHGKIPWEHSGMQVRNSHICKLSTKT